jgi:ribose transport system permease protein
MTAQRSETPARPRLGARTPIVDPAALPALVFVVTLVLLGMTTSDAFLSPFNISNVLVQVTPLLLIALGQSFAVASGGLDLSVGSTASLTAVVAATLFVPLGAPLALAVASLAAVTVGLVNGLAVAWGLEPFLVTLAMLSVVQGVALVIRPTPGGEVPDWYTGISQFWGSVPVALPIVLAVAALTVVFLRRSRTGADVLAVGGDASVARLLGISVERTRIKTYVIAALFAALAGLFLVSRTRTGDPLIGARFALDSLAAVVVGGTALTGGRTTTAGTVLGALALGLLPNVLNLMGVPTFYQTAVKGAILIAAILLPSLASRAIIARRRQKQVRDLLAASGPALS